MSVLNVGGGKALALPPPNFRDSYYARLHVSCSCTAATWMAVIRPVIVLDVHGTEVPGDVDARIDAPTVRAEPRPIKANLDWITRVYRATAVMSGKAVPRCS